MLLTQEEISALIADPTSVQRKILTMIESEADVTITDPTNPFVALLEADAMMTRAGLEETLYAMRANFASLSKTNEDLYHHINDDDIIDMVSVPSKGSFTILVNASNFFGKGYRSETEPDIIQMRIPKYTEITVVGTTFTTMNDIDVRYNTSTKSFMVENISNDHPLALNSLGVVRYSAMRDDVDNVGWLLFELHARQIKRFTFEDTVIVSNGFNKTINMNGEQYYYSEVYMRNTATGDVYKKIGTSLSGFVYDPANPTTHISIVGNNVIYSIPDAYITNGLVSGKIMIVLYTTKGNVYIESNTYSPDKFEIKLGDTTGSDAASVTQNIMLLAKSNFNIEGGKDQRSFEELREHVIYNAIGRITTPVTNFELNRFFDDRGYKLEKIVDSVTERRYLATKNLPIDTEATSRPIMDLYMNRIKLLSGSYDDGKYFYKSGDVAVIKPGAAFKSEDGVVRMLDDAEIGILESLTFNNLKTTLKENKHFYSPYCYVTNISNGIVTMRAYDVASPTISNINVKSKYVGELSVNIDKYGIIYTNTGYQLHLTVISSGQFDDIASYVKLQLAVNISGTNSMVYFYADYDHVEGRFIVDIDTNLIFTDDDALVVTNGISVYSTKTVDLESICNATIFTVDPNTDVGGYAATYQSFTTTYQNAKALSEQTFELKLGSNLKYLFTNATTEYTARKYLTYLTDIELRYDADVYERDPATGTSLLPIYDGQGNCIDVTCNKLHEAGDIVLDDLGEIIYKYRSGDIVLDSGGNPIIDGELGIMRILDINMLEYEYYAATAYNITSYLDNTMINLSKYLSEDMPELNAAMLDNTMALFAHNTVIDDIDVSIGSNVYKVPSTVSPKVTVYIRQEMRDSISDTDTFQTHVGRIIHASIKSGAIDLVGIKNDIVSQLGQDIIYSVVIDGLSGTTGLERFESQTSSKTFGINKAIASDINGDTTVRYDIDFSIQYI